MFLSIFRGQKILINLYIFSFTNFILVLSVKAELSMASCDAYKPRNQKCDAEYSEIRTCVMFYLYVALCVQINPLKLSRG